MQYAAVVVKVKRPNEATMLDTWRRIRHERPPGVECIDVMSPA
jgi:hypothetical protein